MPQDEWNKWFGEHCGKCKYMCEICMYGEDQTQILDFIQSEVIKVFTVNRKGNVEYDNNSGISLSSVKVYNVRDDKNGYPYFLIYENREWKYVSAKHFVPND